MWYVRVFWSIVLNVLVLYPINSNNKFFVKLTKSNIYYNDMIIYNTQLILINYN